VTEAELLMKNTEFAATWSGCCANPGDAGRKLIASDLAMEMGCSNVARGLRFEGGKKWPKGFWGWIRGNLNIENDEAVICVSSLPFSEHDLKNPRTSEVFSIFGTPLGHFERLGRFLEEQGYE
jgi:hypothetical protein